MANAWIVGILGLWTIITPFLRFSPPGYAWNDWIVGVIVAIAGFSMARSQGVIPGIFAVWLFVAGFIPGLHVAPGVYWDNILVGILFAVTGFLAVSQTSRERVQP